MKELVVFLDKKRHLRLTPAALAREHELAAQEDHCVRGPGWPVAATLWLFMLDEDPTLTVGDALRIVRDYVAHDVLGFRKWTLRRLRTQLGAMLHDYRELGA
jgi:hypothetical protein